MRLKLLRTTALLPFVTAAAAFAHPGEHHLTREIAEHTWTWEPVTLLLLAASAGLYMTGAARQRGKAGYSRRDVLYFVAGWLTLFFALVSPVHKIGAMLFSVHMTQHELLVVVAAPLLVMARPLNYLLWALPGASRTSLSGWTRHRRWRAMWNAITAPVFVWLLHGATLWLWHIPSLYQASVESEFVHAMQHSTFLVTALLFWWTLFEGHYGRKAYGMAVLYVFTTAVHTSILGALMTFAERIWYPIYQQRTTEWGMTALQDQQLGGLIMWIPAGTIFIVLGLWLLAAWIRESERRVQYTRVEQTAGGSDAA